MIKSRYTAKSHGNRSSENVGTERRRHKDVHLSRPLPAWHEDPEAVDIKDKLRYEQKTRIPPERGMGLKIPAQVVVMRLSASHPR